MILLYIILTTGFFALTLAFVRMLETLRGNGL